MTRVRDALRRAIGNREWVDVLPPERDLCARLQVSRKTLRAALAVLHRERCVEVRHAKRTRVIARRNAAIRHDGSRVLAVLYPEKALHTVPFNLAQFRILQLDWRAAGYDTVFQNSATLTGAQYARRLRELVRQTDARCWLLLSADEKIQRWFMDEKVPALLGGTPFPGVRLPSMDFDMHAIGVHAAEMFLKLGHRRVAMLNVIKSFAGELRIEEGLAEVMRKQSNAANDALLLHHDETVAGICRVIADALRSPRPPTALLVSGAGHALTVLTHLQRTGRQVPRDLSVMCVDEHPFLSETIPAIAHYVFDWDSHAKRLAQATLRFASRGTLPSRAVQLYPKFVRGESLSPPRQGNEASPRGLPK